MSVVKRFFGKAGLLSFLLVGVMALGAANTFAGTAPVKPKAKTAAAAKTKAPSKTKKAKKKRRHARRSTSKSVKKS